MREKLHVYYWSPFVSKVATVNAVLGSATTLGLYSKGKIIPHIINATLNNATLGEIVESIKTVFGEWEEKAVI